VHEAHDEWRGSADPGRATAPKYFHFVAESELVRKLLVALSESLPEGADLSGVGIESGPEVTVALDTRTPGLLIGRRGTTADAIRSSLQRIVGKRVVKLNIRELGTEDPPPQPGGVREPRPSLPHGPPPLTAQATDDGTEAEP
jgi:predicted RNA-binding protein YlqC (UPF0109 family)